MQDTENLSVRKSKEDGRYEFLIGEYVVGSATARLWDGMQSLSAPAELRERYAKINSFSIKAGYRGRGLGKTFLQQLERALGKEGAAAIVAESWSGSGWFYERNGYRTMGRYDAEPTTLFLKRV